MTSARRAPMAIAACCVVASLAYVGAVTISALVSYVLPSVLVVAVLAVALRRSEGVVVRAVGCAGLGLVLAQLTNVTGGDASGPIARSTFLATIGTAVAVTAAGRTSPAFVTLPVAGILAGALYLGAAGEVLPVLVATVIGLVLALPVLEDEQQKADRGAPRRAIVLALAIVAGGGALGAALTQQALVQRPPVVFEAAQVDERIQPPGSRSATSGSPASLPAPRATPSTVVSAPDEGGSNASTEGDDDTILVLVLIPVVLAAAMLVAVLMRALVVASHWWLLRRRLHRLPGVPASAAAWMWTRLRLTALGLDLPSSVSPDALLIDHDRLNVSDGIATPLRALARDVVDSVFAGKQEPTVGHGRDAWRAAREAVTARRQELSRWRRVVVALRSVPPVPETATAVERDAPTRR